MMNHFLNDWLKQEFKERISQKRTIILTDKLSRAFQLVEIPVTEDMIKEEEEVINVSLKNFQSHSFKEALKNLQDDLKFNQLQEVMRRFQFNSGNLNKDNHEK